MLADQDWAIVDLGWTLKCQRSLREILRMAQPEHLNQREAQGDIQGSAQGYVQGYYLGLLRERLPMAIAGPYRAWLIQADSNRLPTPANCIFQRMSIIEQIFMMADHGTTLGYEQQGDRVQPVFKAERFSAARIAYVEHLHDVVQRYAHTMAQTDLLEQPLTEIRQWAIANMVTLLTQPRRQEVEAIANLNVGDDQNESRAQPIARPVRMQDIVYFAKRLSGLAQARDYAAGFTWLEGGVRLSNPVVQLAYRMALALQTVIRHQEPIRLYRGIHRMRFSLRKRRVG
ncbi:MAG: hypothetical protein HC812_05000 [Leptolyngbya sp. RL_3_1]|nr:hypothetical protein [Leptolyngbya sp. RL_3_1]